MLKQENDGYFPVTIEALPEGTVAYIHTPVFIIRCVCVCVCVCMTISWKRT